MKNWGTMCKENSGRRTESWQFRSDPSKSRGKKNLEAAEEEIKKKKERRKFIKQVENKPRGCSELLFNYSRNLW